MVKKILATGSIRLRWSDNKADMTKILLARKYPVEKVVHSKNYVILATGSTTLRRGSYGLKQN